MEMIFADIDDLRPTMESLYYFIGCVSLVIALVSFFIYQKSFVVSLLSALFVFVLALYVSYHQIDDWYSIKIEDEEVQLLFKTGDIRYLKKNDVVSVQPQFQATGTCIIYIRTENKKLTSIQITDDVCRTSISKIEQSL